MTHDQATDQRPGEVLDTAALTAYLRQHLDGFSEEVQVKQFPSGYSNLTYLVSSGQQAYVLRRPPYGMHTGKAPQHGAGISGAIASQTRVRASAHSRTLL